MAGPITAQVKQVGGSFIKFGKNYMTYIYPNTSNSVHMRNHKTGKIK